jgi:uncharacterized protein (TIGR00266 family)
MDAKITGTTMPVLEAMLQPGESLISEAGELSWMTAPIVMTTHTQMGGGGGFFGAIKRVAGGGSLFMTEYKAQGAVGEVAFAASVPGHIMQIEVSPTSEYMITRGGFMAGTPAIELGVGFQQSLGAGLFGGDGFMLQKVSGTGTAWLEMGGEVVVRELAPGEQLKVHPVHVGAFTSTTKFEITRIAGIKNMMFGGDGIFLALLTGPGTVWLQTMPPANLAAAIQPYLPQPTSSSSSSTSSSIGGAVLGGLAGSLLGGNKK